MAGVWGSLHHKLVYEYKDHSFVIDKEEAKELLGNIVKVNTNEYKFGNEIHKFLNDINIIIDIIYSKSIGIVGDASNFILADKKRKKVDYKLYTLYSFYINNTCFIINTKINHY